MDPVVKIAFDILGALFSVFGKPVLDAALGHHGYVPRRVEEVRPPEGHGHAQTVVDELRAGNTGPVEDPGPGSSTR